MEGTEKGKRNWTGSVAVFILSFFGFGFGHVISSQGFQYLLLSQQLVVRSCKEPSNVRLGAERGAVSSGTPSGCTGVMYGVLHKRYST